MISAAMSLATRQFTPQPNVEPDPNAVPGKPEKDRHVILVAIMISISVVIIGGGLWGMIANWRFTCRPKYTFECVEAAACAQRLEGIASKSAAPVAQAPDLPRRSGIFGRRGSARAKVENLALQLLVPPKAMVGSRQSRVMS